MKVYIWEELKIYKVSDEFRKTMLDNFGEFCLISNPKITTETYLDNLDFENLYSVLVCARQNEYDALDFDDNALGVKRKYEEYGEMVEQEWQKFYDFLKLSKKEEKLVDKGFLDEMYKTLGGEERIVIEGPEKFEVDTVEEVNKHIYDCDTCSMYLYAIDKVRRTKQRNPANLQDAYAEYRETMEKLCAEVERVSAKASGSGAPTGGEGPTGPQ